MPAQLVSAGADDTGGGCGSGGDGEGCGWAVGLRWGGAASEQAVVECSCKQERPPRGRPTGLNRQPTNALVLMVGRKSSSSLRAAVALPPAMEGGGAGRRGGGVNVNRARQRPRMIEAWSDASPHASESLLERRAAPRTAEVAAPKARRAEQPKPRHAPVDMKCIRSVTWSASLRRSAVTRGWLVLDMVVRCGGRSACEGGKRARAAACGWRPSAGSDGWGKAAGVLGASAGLARGPQAAWWPVGGASGAAARFRAV